MTRNRKISLTKIHAINWYGYADSVPVAGNLLLAGVTGSGKSILMDLLQFVLIGDRRLVKFNQSATGAASSRDLKGYCLGDIKEDEGGVVQYMRQSSITYAAIELTWPDLRRVETWGLRVEFASAAEQQGRVSPFWCEGALERGDFLTLNAQGKRVPREMADFRAFVDERGGEVYTGIDEYRRDMASPGHLNFEHSVLSRLLPTAMSFTFLRSFNEFCRQFILPVERLRHEDVTSSYRTFAQYQAELKMLRAQLEGLQQIRGYFQQAEALERDARLGRYLSAELAAQHAQAERATAEKRLAELQTEAARETARLAELDEIIPRRREEITQLAAMINQSPEGQLYTYIKGENEKLVRRVEELRQIGRSLESTFANRLARARAWADQVAKLPFTLESGPVQALERALAQAEAGGLARADETLRVVSEAAREAVTEASRAARPTLEPLAKLRHELAQLREEVAALKLGRLPFPARLLDALNQRLYALNEPAARHLCQLCEVKDERWRPAIEIAFTRKFAIVVSAENYDEAERAYHELRAEALGREAGRESLINPAKALKMGRTVKPGSLAEKLETTHAVAAALVSHLFGDVMCVEKREELRAHDHAIMPDGFMTRGAFVERVRHYDNLPFVGQRGLEQQRLWKEAQLKERESEERRLAPLEALATEVQSRFREVFENQSSLYEELLRVRELPELEQKLTENIAKLNGIDRAQFDEWEQQRRAYAAELREWEREQRGLLENQIHKEVQRATDLLATATNRALSAKEEFERVTHESDVSAWLPRLEELRAAMLAQYSVEVASERFRGRALEAEREALKTRGELHLARQQFADHHPKFNDLPVHAEENVAYDRVLAKIEDADIPGYEEKSREERRKWEHLFREQILEKLRAALGEVKNIISLLNTLLSKPIGTSRYYIEHRRNPDFDLYHDLLSATATAGTDLFASIEDARLRDLVADFLKLLVETPDSLEAARLLDYRHYFEYDMVVEDISVPQEQRRKISVDRQSGKFSGGENQAPYFVAILASYLRAYRRHDRHRVDPTLALVPIDEAFSKLSGERITDCIEALKQLDLQGVFSMSTGNIPYAFEKCDHLIVVSKVERRIGRKLNVRNVAVSLARESEEGRRFLQEFE